MTAAVIRAYIQHNLGEQQPLIKVYYIAPMFRQERPQAGRLRQFHQFGAEAIGGSLPAIDADVIALSAEIYRKLGLANFEVKINSVGCEKCRPAYKEKLKSYLQNVLDKLSEESRRRFEQNPLRILDSKDENDKESTKLAPLMKDHLCGECSIHFNDVQKILTSLSVKFSVDGRIVRGLDYYTKTAYEIVSTDLGSQDALTGGGRYDLLVNELGGKPTPSVGFAAGIERLLTALEKNELFSGNDIQPKIFIAAADDAGRDWAIRQNIEFRRNGIASEIDWLKRSLKSQMREADRQKAGYVLVVGANELQKKEIMVKNMKTAEQHPVLIMNLMNYFQVGGGKNEERKTS